jgi:hypothetical protein
MTCAIGVENHFNHEIDSLFYRWPSMQFFNSLLASIIGSKSSCFIVNVYSVKSSLELMLYCFIMCRIKIKFSYLILAPFPTILQLYYSDQLYFDFDPIMDANKELKNCIDGQR